jgi:nicotinate-nucleotide pyrophosphorylase (carboxylating)
MFLPSKILEEKLLRMVAEDTGQGDVTTASIVPVDVIVEAAIVTKNSGIIAGIEETKTLLESMGLHAEALVRDGDKATSKETLIRIKGDARVLLSTERTLLNLISRMSGIATATHGLIEKLRKARLKAKVACTRKTAPGLLFFDKKAVLIGGGDTHRLHLDDMILIKDNHIKVAGGIEKAVQKAKKTMSFSKKTEVEVSRIQDVLTAAKSGADILMFDNFSPEQIEKACTMLKKAKLFGKLLLEASGGITRENILKYASTGVDIVSLGEITNNAKSLDMSLEITRVYKEQSHG